MLKSGVFVVYHRNVNISMVKRIKTLFYTKFISFEKIQFNRFLAHGQQRNLISYPRFHG